MHRSLGTVALLAMLLGAPLASAHATLERAAPAVDAVAPVGTATVDLTFSERVARIHTDADVFDMNGTSHKRGAPAFNDDTPHTVRIELTPLDNGIYAVAWKTLSIDGHTARGSYFFGTGNASLVATGAVTNVDTPTFDAPRSLAESVARAIFFAGLVLTAGWAAFILCVDVRTASPTLLRAMSAQAFVGSAASLFGIAYLAQRTGIDGATLLEASPGLSIAFRTGLLLLTGLLALVALTRPAPARRPWVIAITCAATSAIVATSLGSHAAASRDAVEWAVAADIMHLVAAAIWAGGIVGFLTIMRRREPGELRRMIARFSPLALGSLVLLGVTGTASAIMHLNHVSELWTTGYGRLVATKAALVIPIAAMGIQNRRQSAHHADAAAARRFRRSLVTQAVVLTLIIVAAGALASSASPTAPPESAAPDERAWERTAVTDTTHMVFRVEPTPPETGNQTFIIQLHALTLGGIPNGTTVALRFAAPGESEPGARVDATPIAPGEWRTQGNHMSTAGTWRVFVLMERPDDTSQITFDVPVKTAGTNPR